MVLKQIRAIYDEKTIRVYQAYSPEIALPALEAGTFVSPFKMSRMTWIKPSFCWMMYRSGYALKQGQEVILAIDILREGFDWAIEHAAISSFLESPFKSKEEWQKHLSNSCVRVQWDPERDIQLNKFENLKTIQIGLTEQAVKTYVNEWIRTINDVTHLAKSAVQPDSKTEFPNASEKLYPISNKAEQALGI
jgi:hypothetical protein